jgi:hypothetical protein
MAAAVRNGHVLLRPTQDQHRRGFPFKAATPFAEYRQSLEATGFTNIELSPTHSVAAGMHSAIVRAIKPTISNKGEASATSDSCCGVNACCTLTEQADAPITIAGG